MTVAVLILGKIFSAQPSLPHKGKCDGGQGSARREHLFGLSRHFRDWQKSQAERTQAVHSITDYQCVLPP